MTDIRKYNIYDVGTVCFALSEADSWRIAKVSATEDKPTGQCVKLRTSKEDGTEGGDDESPPLEFEVQDPERLFPLQEGCLAPVRDLLDMNYLHDAVLLNQVRMRYWQGVIYTNIGPIVLALNPYDFTLPLYVDSNMPKYIKEKSSALYGGSSCPTHVWSVAHNAYWLMITNSTPQSILVSGESGAGKTEAAKIVTKYLAVCSTYFAQEDEQARARLLTSRIEHSSPILEAFGNARTLRNDNSSRFGKFMKLQFNSKGFLHGCFITNYLLEKSRVIGHARGERSYHTFYQLAHGASAGERQRYRLHDTSKFSWIYFGIPKEEQPEGDAEEYLRVRDAFGKVGFTAAEQDVIYSVIAGILHLQQLQFSSRKDEAFLDEAGLETLKFVASLWKIDFSTLYKELTTTTLSPQQSEAYVRAHTAAQAAEVRNALSKALYERTFQLIVDRLNRNLDRQGECPADRWIGLLDIFGFENFEANSFEQLCINFANEQLQNHYNTCVFSRDMAEYEAENINTASITPPNNQPTLDLIGANMGILALLSDQGRTGTDEKFLSLLFDRHKHQRALRKPRISNGTFGVAHYAGEVWYTAKGMREKNVDPLKDPLRLLVRSSEDDTIARTHGCLGQSTTRSPSTARSGGTRTGLRLGRSQTATGSTRTHCRRLSRPIHPTGRTSCLNL